MSGPAPAAAAALPPPVRPSAADEAWLRMDRPESRMIITAVMRTTRPLGAERLAGVIESRLLTHDRFRSPLLPRALRALPREGFDLGQHLHRVELPQEGGEDALQAWIASQMSKPLPLERPLWEVSLVEHWGEGSVLVWRLHHALADGIALMRVLLGAADEPPPPTELTLPLRNTRPFHGLRLAVGGPLSLLKLLLLPRDAALAHKAPLSGTKRVAWSEPLSLERIKHIAQREGATVNDVLVSAVSGALHTWLTRHVPQRVPHSLRALVPFDLRVLGRDPPLGNRFGLVYLTLPVGALSSARERLREVKRRMGRIKRTPEAVVAYRIVELIGRLAPVLASLGIRLFARKASLVLTNVAGPRRPLSLGGAPLQDIFFWVPQAGSLGIGLSLFSYAGTVRVGIAADVVRMKEPEELVALVSHELEVLEQGLP
ncbi:MAG TPA: WS/DGAT domain-containing protein [Aggregicoccus sp.]|nr:WS/DGAT domain-containing protein [Aggregicoccus sp.]